jgi:cytochrome c5
MKRNMQDSGLIAMHARRGCIRLPTWRSLVIAAAVLLGGCGDGQEAARVPAVSQPEPDLATKQGWGGAKVYDEVCDKCHKMGVDGAPELGDPGAWKARLAKGEDVLMHHVREGFNKMPPKGRCEFCTDEQLRAAMNFMLDESGAR